MANDEATGNHRHQPLPPEARAKENRARTYPADMPLIVTPARFKKGPPRHVIRLHEQTPKANDAGQKQEPQRPVIRHAAAEAADLDIRRRA